MWCYYHCYSTFLSVVFVDTFKMHLLIIFIYCQMSIDLLLKFSLFHIAANIKQDNRMLLSLLKAKCRIMPVYYFEQPCKLSYNESFTGRNINILNLTCSPDTTGEKNHFVFIYIGLCVLCAYVFLLSTHPAVFDPLGRRRSLSGDHEKVRDTFWMCPYYCPSWWNFLGSYVK